AGTSPARRGDHAPPGTVRLLIDVAEAGVVRIVTARPGAPAEVRVVDTPDLNLVTLEVVAQIVRASARASLEGAAPIEPGSAGVATVAAQSPPPPPPPAP